MSSTLKESMTTGQVAQLLEVSCRTVSKWGDTGKLKQWKINKDRRFCKSEVFEFAKQNGFSGLLTRKGIGEAEVIKETQDLEGCIEKMNKYKAACDAATECFRNAKFNLETKCYQVTLEAKKKLLAAIEQANT